MIVRRILSIAVLAMGISFAQQAATPVVAVTDTTKAVAAPVVVDSANKAISADTSAKVAIVADSTKATVSDSSALQVAVDSAKAVDTTKAVVTEVLEPVAKDSTAKPVVAKTEPVKTPAKPKVKEEPVPVSMNAASADAGKEAVIENPWEFVLVAGLFLGSVLLIMFSGEQ